MTDCDKILNDAEGRWYGILSRYGIDVGDGKHCPCPLCGGKDRFRFDNKENKGTWICNQCGAGDGLSLLMKKLNLEFIPACEEVAKVTGTITSKDMNPEKVVTPDRLREMFKSSKPIKPGDPVTEYLRNRGLSDFPPTLRYSPKCWEYETHQEHNAMLAVFALANGEAVTIHRTFIRDGKKLAIEKPKKIMPRLKPMAGGAVRLYPGEHATLGVCEGIETAIAVHQLFDVAVWPCLSAHLLEMFQPPPWAKKIEIFGDNDETCTGQKAAYTLANRLIVKDKIPATVIISSCKDFLDDLVNGKGMAKK